MRLDIKVERENGSLSTGRISVYTVDRYGRRKNKFLSKTFTEKTSMVDMGTICLTTLKKGTIKSSNYL